MKRRDITKSKVRSAPPIEIVCELWIIETQGIGGIIHACMTVLTHKGQPQIGVRLPVSTALVEDDVLLEGIVAHEFLHCFHTLQEVIAGIKLGLRKINDQFDRSSREEDDARLAPLTDWFDQEISIPHHNEEACLRELKRHFVTLREELPIKTPTDEFVTHSLAIPDDVVEPIELLLRH